MCVGALLCFLAYKLVVLAVICARKNMNGAQLCVATCYFFEQKRRKKKTRSGACMSRCTCERMCSARGAGCKCAAALMVVGLVHASLSGIGQSERAKDMSSGHVMLMPCSAGYI